MNTAHLTLMHETVTASLNDALSFPESVARLREIGVERYHADYSRQERTFYFADGRSLVVPVPLEPYPIGTEFSAPEVEAAVRASQRGEHRYVEFLRKTMAAGCVGYFVQIAGRRVIYFGRNGEAHVEHFPPAPAD